MTDLELYHYGVKGMRWGVRRYQNKDGSLNDRGIKRYAKKGYAQDSLNSNKTRAGRAFDQYTGAHKLHGSVKYDMSSKKANKARAEQYLKEKNSRKQPEFKSKKVSQLKGSKRVRLGDRFATGVVKANSSMLYSNIGKAAGSVVGKAIGGGSKQTTAENLGSMAGAVFGYARGKQRAQAYINWKYDL